MGRPYFPTRADSRNTDVEKWLRDHVGMDFDRPRPFRVVWSSRPHLRALLTYLVLNRIEHVTIKHEGGVTEVTNMIDRMNVCPKCKGSGRIA